MSDFWEDMWYDGPDDHQDYDEAEYSSGGYYFVRRGERIPPHCRECHSSDVVWKKDTAGRWFLADAETGLPHDCDDDLETLL